MKQLEELIGMVNKQKIKNLNIITHAPKEGKLYELYEGVHDGVFENDEDAMKSLYGTASTSKENYRKLKSRLVDQLTNTIFFVGDSEGFSKQQSLIYDCVKNSAAAKIIRLRSGYANAEALAKKTLKTAIAIEETAVVVELTELLRGLVGRRGDEKIFNKYNQLFEKYSEMLRIEYQAKGYLERITMMTTRSASIAKLIPITREFEAKLRAIKSENKTTNTLVYSYFIYVSRCEFENDHEGLQNNCEEIINYLEQKENVSGNFIFAFLAKSIDTYIRFQQFEKGREVLRKCLTYATNPLSINWILIKFQYIRLALFCNRIEEGYLEYLIALDSKAIDRLSAGDQEPWEIFKGYFSWFQNVGLLKANVERTKTKAFRPGKFINMVPIQNKDKEGYNASVLVLQLLFLIQMKKNNELIDQLESFKAYAYRYLRKKQMARTHAFVNLLLLIPTNYFNKIAVIRKSKKWLDKLHDHPLSETSITVNMEYVPYEILWEIVLDMLDNSFYKSTRK